MEVLDRRKWGRRGRGTRKTGRNETWRVRQTRMGEIYREGQDRQR